MSCTLAELAPCQVRGVSWWLDRRRCVYRIQFRKGGRTKSLTHASTHAPRVYREFLEMAERFNRGAFDPWAERQETLTLEDAARRYEAALRRERSANYADQARDVLRALCAGVGPGRLLVSVTAEQVKQYYAARHRARATQKTYFGVLRAFFRWCVRQGYLDESPLRHERAPRTGRRPPAYFTPEEFLRLIATLESEIALRAALPLRGAARASHLADLPNICRLGVETGLRRGELLHLRWMDVDLPKTGSAGDLISPIGHSAPGRLHVRSYHDKRRGFRFEPKSRSDRIVPMSPGARAIFLRRQEARTDEDDTALVFPGRQGRPRDGHNLSETFRRYRRKAGLSERLHFHSLRHTCASWLASSGVPLLVIKEMMGHADLRTTMQYAHLLPDASLWPGSRYHEALAQMEAAL